MADSFLSQEEIDALLEGVTGESQKLAKEEAPTGAVRDYKGMFALFPAEGALVVAPVLAVTGTAPANAPGSASDGDAATRRGL